MIGLFIIQAAALAATGSPAATPSLAIEGDHLLLHHLVAPGEIPRGVSADMRLLTAPAGRRTLILTREAQERLLRRRLPAVRLAPRASGAVRLVFAPRGLRKAGGACFELREPLAAGAWVSVEQVSAVPCNDARVAAPLAYDRVARVPRTRLALAAGSYLGAIELPPTLPQPRGAALTLRTRVGPVTIYRDAILEQPGWAGRPAFVRLSDGNIIAAPLADEGERP
jgi:hypothetical protein